MDVIPAREQIASFPDPLTEGELALVRYLEQALPTGWTIYVQPYLNGSRPDLVLCHPQIRVMIYEVKDWNLACYRVDCAAGTGARFQVRGPASTPVEVRSPLEQVEYRRTKIIEQLLPALVEWVDVDPRTLGFVVVGLYFHQATTQEARDFLAQAAHAQVSVVGRDGLTPERITAVVPDTQRHTSQFWQSQWNKEILLWLQPPYNATDQGTYLELTPEQKALVRPAPGHQRLRGVAGSGKTQILACRAAQLAGLDYDVLILTYNITLWHNIRDLLRSYWAGPLSLELARRMIRPMKPPSISADALSAGVGHFSWRRTGSAVRSDWSSRPPSTSARSSLSARLPDAHWLDRTHRADPDVAHPSNMVVPLPTHQVGQECVECFSGRGVEANYVFPDGWRARHKQWFWMGDGRLKMSTIHSFKGWELLNVILYLPLPAAPGFGRRGGARRGGLHRDHPHAGEPDLLNANPHYAAFGRTLPSS